jgi:molybdenum cofactor synthesis domain-containing protein
VKKAALVVIGDEILTGKVKDENSFIFAQIMFERGVEVGRIEVIPDVICDIGDTVKRLAQNYDYVCTSGGVGPTHDDRTFEGIAYGFSLPIKEHSEAVNYFQSAQARAGRGQEISLAQRKMLAFPSPCQVHFIEPLWLPLVIVKNVYIFPGVPFLFTKLIEGFAHLFNGGKFFREIVFTDLAESQIAFDLKIVQDNNPDVAIGSYPQAPGTAYNVMVTVEGRHEKSVNNVAKELIPLIKGRKTADHPY